MSESAGKIPYVPGLGGVPAAESKMCFIDGNKGQLLYRGYPIEELAASSTFEETAWLLLKGELPKEAELRGFERELWDRRRLKYKIVDLLKCLPETGHPMEALMAGVAALGMFYPGGKNEAATLQGPVSVYNAQERWAATVRLLAKVPTIIAAFHRLREGNLNFMPREDLSTAANFLFMLTGKEPHPVSAKVFDVCLILHAEHSMNASTFSARVTASTLSDPFSVISAAIGTLRGPLHGGANEAGIEMLKEIGSVANVPAYLDKLLLGKKKIVGFGHREYKVKDPRANVLQKLAEQLFQVHGATPLYDIARAVEDYLAPRIGPKGIFPNVDFYSGIVYDRMGIPRDLFIPIFAMARTAGWLSHFWEQVANNRIFRPSQIYVGSPVRAYTPIARR
ncbi:MAG TPA: citrate synthase [bacterium]|nr:citrate synthase [bacterium]